MTKFYTLMLYLSLAGCNYYVGELVTLNQKCIYVYFTCKDVVEASIDSKIKPAACIVRTKDDAEFVIDEQYLDVFTVGCDKR